MKVKIIKCDDDKTWYFNLIGKMYEVKDYLFTYYTADRKIEYFYIINDFSDNLINVEDAIDIVKLRKNKLNRIC